MTTVWKLDELIALFDVEALGKDRFRARSLPERIRPEDEARGMVEGSQILGQALVAASRAESDRFVKSAHMIFARPANTAAPIELTLDRLHSGRGFSSCSVTAHQGERSCARGLFLLDAGAPDFVHHAAAMPDVPGPDAAAPYEMPLEGRELRIAGGADFEEPDAIGPPRLDVWVRYARAPEEPAVRQALLADLCGPFTIGTSLRPHAGFGQAQAHRTLSTGVLSLTVHFHEASALDDWLLYSHESVHTGRGLCDGHGRIFERGGRLVASFSQEGLLRPLPAQASAGRSRRDVL